MTSTRTGPSARVVTVHHADPYVVTPARYPRDVSAAQASAQWATQTEPDGPAWVALGAVPALVAGDSHVAVQLLYRILAAAGILAALGLVALRTGSARAVAFLGWSPLIALHYSGGGHNDAWMVVALVAAVAWRGTPGGGAAWALGSALKGVPAVSLAARASARTLSLPTKVLGRARWLRALHRGSRNKHLSAFRWATASAVGVHSTSPIGGVHFLTEAGLRHRYAVAIGGLVFIAIYVALLREAWRHGRARLSLAASALCMCSSLLRPWYALWPVALAAVEEDTAAELVAFALSAYVLFADAIPT